MAARGSWTSWRINVSKAHAPGKRAPAMNQHWESCRITSTIVHVSGTPTGTCRLREEKEIPSSSSLNWKHYVLWPIFGKYKLPYPPSGQYSSHPFHIQEALSFPPHPPISPVPHPITTPSSDAMPRFLHLNQIRVSSLLG